MIENFKTKRWFNPVKNSFWSIAEVSIYPLLMLACTPFFINGLGVEIYGLWILVNSISGGLGFFNSGVGDAIIYFIAKKKGSHEADEMRLVVNDSVSLALLFSVLLGLLLFCFAHLLVAYDVFNLREQLRLLAFEAIIYSSVLLVSRNLEQVFLSVFKGMGRYDVSGQLGLVSKMLQLAVAFFSISSGAGLLNLFRFSLVASFVMVLIIAFVLKRKYPDLTLFPRFKFTNAYGILSYGSWSWLQSLFTVAASQVDKYLVAYYAGLEILSYYSIGYLFFSQLHTLFAAGGAWVFQKVSTLSGNKKALKQLFLQAVFIFALLSQLLLVAAYAVADPVLNRFLGHVFYSQSRNFIYGFFSYEALMMLTIIPFYFLNGTGHIRINTGLEVGAKLLNIVAMIAFFHWYGVDGIVYGLICSAAVYLPVQHLSALRAAFEKPVLVRSLLLIVPALIAAFAFALSSHFPWVIVPSGIILFLAFKINLTTSVKK